jgi:hypothetical protein
MPVETGAPPVNRQPRALQKSYTEFVNAIVHEAGGWVSLSLDEVTGSSGKYKQSNVLQCAKSRGVLIHTSVQEGRLYARLRQAART